MSGMMSSLASSVIQNNPAAEMYAMIGPSLSPSLDTGFCSSGEAEADEEGATER